METVPGRRGRRRLGNGFQAGEAAGQGGKLRLGGSGKWDTVKICREAGQWDESRDAVRCNGGWL